MPGTKRALEWLLRHKGITVLTTLVIFLVVVSGFAYVPKIFFPPSDRTYFKAELELPIGTTIETMRATVVDMEDFVRAELAINAIRSEGVTNWATYVGNAGPKFLLAHNPKPSSSNYALMVINVSSAERIADLMEKISRYALDNHPDLDVKLRLIENGPAIENPVEVRMSGSDSNKLFAAVGTLKQKMNDIGGLTNVGDDWGQRIKKLEIWINQARALRAGITSQDIAVSLQAGLSGMELTEYREGEDVIPVVLRSNASSLNDINKVESLSVFSQTTGLSVPFRQVADVNVVWDAAKIYRRDGLRTVSVGAQLSPGNTAADKFAQLIPWLQEQEAKWGLDVRYQLGGENESSGKANQSIADKLPLAGFIILVLLVAQFNSMRKAFIILTTIPLGLIGVVLGLLLADTFFGFMTLLGIISLAGIVINNAIVLLERIKLELDSGVPHQQAIVKAAQQRARPILLTTATTVLGLIPLYLGGGEMWEPMAVAIMAGLLFSTVLTLAVVPVLYASLYRVKC